MIQIIRTDSTNNDFLMLVRLLDHELNDKMGEEQSFFDQFNKLDSIRHVAIARIDEEAVGCGAFKLYKDNVVEVKRMFVLPGHRGKGIANSILTELESWAKELGFSACILETAQSFTPAVGLYKKSGYHIIPNYGQYENVESSVCMEKLLK